MDFSLWVLILLSVFWGVLLKLEKDTAVFVMLFFNIFLLVALLENWEQVSASLAILAYLVSFYSSMLYSNLVLSNFFRKTNE
jgi:uncharacterized membrane protein